MCHYDHQQYAFASLVASLLCLQECSKPHHFASPCRNCASRMTQVTLMTHIPVRVVSSEIALYPVETTNMKWCYASEPPVALTIAVMAVRIEAGRLAQLATIWARSGSVSVGKDVGRAMSRKSLGTTVGTTAFCVFRKCFTCLEVTRLTHRSSEPRVGGSNPSGRTVKECRLPIQA